MDDAYERFHGTGPAWGEDQLTDHGPSTPTNTLTSHARIGDSAAPAPALHVTTLIRRDT